MKTLYCVDKQRMKPINYLIIENDVYSLLINVEHMLYVVY